MIFRLWARFQAATAERREEAIAQEWERWKLAHPEGRNPTHGDYQNWRRSRFG